jgi:predicted CoA-substrate-specific enzyme activase
MKYHLGIDIGSISVNTVLLDRNNRIFLDYYDYCEGRPYHVMLRRLKSILSEGYKLSGLTAITGTGGKTAADLLNARYVNEVIAQSTAVSLYYPEARTVIEMGGEDSKLLFMEDADIKGTSGLSDFCMNSLCAAGTGSFLDQQAKRLGISIIGEFGELAMKSLSPPRIAGRCSVFAKSDMIHLQQVATPVHDIIAGLCFAVARNFKSTVGRGRDVVKPVIFQGGVAANAGMVRAFREIYGLYDGELIIPDHYASMGAAGAVLNAIQNGAVPSALPDLRRLEKYLENGRISHEALKPLVYGGQVADKGVYPIAGNSVIDAWLGIDVGSLSTNLVVIDKQKRVLARRYLPTAGRPLEAIRTGLKEINGEVGSKVNIVAVGTTGSGRYLTGDFVGADLIVNEITAQGTAAIEADPGVDTVFEIGGQDSKYIRIENGVIVDFEMNKVCAAGTGSFLEEQANKMNINIVNEFAALGLQAAEPVKLGERCTVFMESDLNTCQQQGLSRDNLIAGLAYSIVQNYLNRVVRDKPVGNRILFQGGVTNNKAVIAAFESATGKKLVIPPHFDITGAIGAAMLAGRHMSALKSAVSHFKGFEISNVKYVSESFSCEHCANHCEIMEIRIGNEEEKLFYGGICERYEKRSGPGKNIKIPDLFLERERMLSEGYSGSRENGKITMGIPRGLMNYYQMFPFWNTFFRSLGFNVLLSGRTDREIITNSLEIMAAETCLPVEVMHGHVIDLLNRKADYVFLPFVVNSAGGADNPTNNCNCPWVQAHPYLLKAAFGDRNIREKLLMPSLHFRYEHLYPKELEKFFSGKFGLPPALIKKAIRNAWESQHKFEEKVRARGREVLSDLSGYKNCVVLLGRPYNTSDPSLNLRLVQKLIKMEILPLPVDFLPLEEMDVFGNYPSMYWPNGQKIIAAAKFIAGHDKLFPVYISNFKCGPDSFLLHFVKSEISNKPMLHLEVDEHSADAGMITRIEAFTDSLKGYSPLKKAAEIHEPEQTGNFAGVNVLKRNNSARTIFFPYARDTVHMMSAATRYCGIPSEVLPMATQEDLELGRKYTNGQECFPMICTTGSFLRKLMEPATKPEKVSFFMPDHNGPCRFGEYNRLQRIIFDNLGFKDVTITHPSNNDSYAAIAPGSPVKWRTTAWKGIVALDLIRKMLEKVRPYEKLKGQTDRVYKKNLERLIGLIETGAKNITTFIREAEAEFASIPCEPYGTKPVVAIVGEVFMRDNPFCSNYLVQKLENLGAETMVAPFAEWVDYSSLRYIRDSRWKRNYGDLLKARIQLIFQESIEKRISKSVTGLLALENEISVRDMLESCGEYINRDYDGDPPLAIGSANILAGRGISGVVNILPFTCLPGTINCAVSNNLRKDHNGLPWENFAYDGNENIGQETRFEAFFHQVKKYHSADYIGKQPSPNIKKVTKKSEIAIFPAAPSLKEKISVPGPET